MLYSNSLNNQDTRTVASFDMCHLEKICKLNLERLIHAPCLIQNKTPDPFFTSRIKMHKRFKLFKTSYNRVPTCYPISITTLLVPPTRIISPISLLDHIFSKSIFSICKPLKQLGAKSFLYHTKRSYT